MNPKTCPECSQPVPDGARFCPHCGRALQTAQHCKQCGAENPEGARYCVQCGSALSQRAPAPEKKGIRKPAVGSRWSTNPYLTILLVGFLAMVVATVYNFQLLNKERKKLATGMSTAMTQAPEQNGSSELSQEELEAHLKLIKEKLKETPNDVELNIQMGNLLFDTQRFKEAIPYYKKALMLKPNNPDVIVDLGVCYYNLGEYEKAREQFDRALNVDPNHVNALYNRGIVAVKLKQFEDLMSAWGKLTKIAPNSPQAKQAQQILDEIHRQAQQKGTN